MHINFTADILKLMTYHFIYEDMNEAEKNSFKMYELYKYLDKVDFEDSMVCLSEKNFKTIIDFFNNEKNIVALEQEILSLLGLDGIIKGDGVYLMDIGNHSNAIHSIACSISGKVFHPRICHIIEDKKQELFNLIKDGEDDYYLNQFFRNKHQIHLLEIEMNSNQSLSLKFETNYTIKSDLASHLEKFREKRMLLKTTTNYECSNIKLNAHFRENLK